MNNRAIIALLAWLMAIAGLATNAHYYLWQFLRAHGLGGHPLGVLFVWIPIGLLATEWAVLIAIPILAVFHLARKKQNEKGA